MKLKILAMLFLSFFASYGLGQVGAGKPKPLYFPADKNKVQILPQRFEYNLLDADRLTIGDVLIDTTKVTFKVEPSREITGTYRLQFNWPAGLISSGQLAIKNNTGKAILSKIVEKENLKITKDMTEEIGDGMRNDVANFTIDGIEPKVIDDMKLFPFMSFCVYRESENTRLYLCSKELYISTQSGQMNVKQRSSTKKPAQIEVNGKIVGNQGIIYLNNRSENVLFKLQTQTGAFLEIETRRKDVDFKDVISAEKSEDITITAAGAEPVDESNVTKLNATDWQTNLPKNRPVLFLKGDSDIPMRQELYVRGSLPSAKFRPYISPKAPSQTYSGRVIINGVTPDGVQIKSAGNSDSQVQNTKKNQFQWTIDNIPSGQVSRHYLNVDINGNTFVARHDIQREKPLLLGLSTYYQVSQDIAYGELEIQWWIDNLIGIRSDWAHLHWGLAIDNQTHILEKKNSLNLDITTLELKWRAQEGFNLIDESWGLTLPMQMLRTKNSNGSALGFGAFWQFKPKKYLNSYMSWLDLRLNYFSSPLQGDLKIKSALSFKLAALLSLSSNWYLNYYLNLGDFKFTPNNSDEETQVGVGLGLNYKF